MTDLLTSECHRVVRTLAFRVADRARKDSQKHYTSDQCHEEAAESRVV